MRQRLAVILVLLLFSSLSAAPVAESERLPIDLQRTISVPTDPDGFVIELHQLLVDNPQQD